MSFENISQFKKNIEDSILRSLRMFKGCLFEPGTVMRVTSCVLRSNESVEPTWKVEVDASSYPVVNVRCVPTNEAAEEIAKAVHSRCSRG